MKVDLLRFEVLKQLKMAPTFGYDLFLIFSNRNLIQKPAELYKILRSMKDSKLLQVKLVDAVHGKKKEILSPTHEGLKYYYERIVESIQISMSLIMDLTFRKLSSEIYLKIENFGILFSESEMKNILVLLDHLPISQQVQIITTFFEKQKNSVILYIKTNSKKPNDSKELESLFKRGYPIKILDQNMGLKKNSIDIIITLGINNEINFKELLRVDAGDSLIPYLKENGVIMVGFVRERDRDKPGILIELFKDYLDELPEEIQDQVFQEFQYFIMISKLYRKPMSNEEIIRTFTKSFQEVNKLELLNIMDLFIAKNPKI